MFISRMNILCFNKSSTWMKLIRFYQLSLQITKPDSLPQNERIRAIIEPSYSNFKKIAVF